MKKNLLLVLLVLILGVVVYYSFFNRKKVLDEKVLIDNIKEYNYSLYDVQYDEYKDKFKYLKELLKSDEINEEEYVKTITEMFIIDFYSLDNKISNLDIGGVDFVYSKMQDNFMLNAKDTMYKYVESNIYGDRKQTLPIVDEVEIQSIKKVTFYYENSKDLNAYQVNAKWTYKKDLGYENEKMFYFVHEENKLSLVEMS